MRHPAPPTAWLLYRNLRFQSIELLGSQLEHEVFGKATAVALHGLIEPMGRDTRKLGKVPVHFWGRVGGVVPTPDETVEAIRKFL